MPFTVMVIVMRVAGPVRSRATAVCNARRASTGAAWPRGSPRCRADRKSGWRASARPQWERPAGCRTTNGRGPTAPNANDASPDCADDAADTHDREVDAMTACESLECSAGALASASGTSIDSTISPGASTVRPGPVKKSIQRHCAVFPFADEIQAAP